jgi:cytoskeletal protein RodZ
MVESVGKKLNQARVKRGLTIDEAAHATRLRPDKITALENDDYSRFANNIYAKGFLQIYARFLGVDVTDFARTLDNANPISVSDYQYLSNAPTPRQEPAQVRREERRPPSLAPLFFFLGVIAIGGAFFIYENVRTNALRLEKGHKSDDSGPAEQTTANAVAPSPESAAPAPAPVPASPAPAFHGPAKPPTVAVGPSATPSKPSTPPPAQTNVPGPTAAASTPAPAPGATPSPSAGPLAAGPTPDSRDRDFVNPTPVSTNDPSTHPVAAGGANEVLVATVKKTWVTVRKDDPKAPPIFEDYVYPSANPLKLKGGRFFIDARDPASIQITKNGLPYTYESPDAPVQ